MNERELIDHTPIRWSQNIIFLWKALGALALSVAGYLVALFRPHWFEGLFVSAALLAALAVALHIQNMMEFRREHSMWFLNRPKRR